VWGQLEGWTPRLEWLFRDAQEFEFTIESGRAYLLQSRNAKRTAAARVRIAHDLFSAGLIEIREARARIGDVDLDALVQRRLQADDAVPLAHALVGAPGVAVGRLAVSRGAVERLRVEGAPVVLAAKTADPEDYPLLPLLAGLLTRHGGVTSHAAVAALEARVPALVGCEALSIIAESGVASFDSTRVAEGEWISLEGADSGRVFAGALPEQAPELSPGISEEILRWARALQAAPSG
jgi:pyruvate,orthophosphate dikinase